jgi:hypothetical protein
MRSEPLDGRVSVPAKTWHREDRDKVWQRQCSVDPGSAVKTRDLNDFVVEVMARWA